VTERGLIPLTVTHLPHLFHTLIVRRFRQAALPDHV
jgi:hypothetical protein